MKNVQQNPLKTEAHELISAKAFASQRKEFYEQWIALLKLVYVLLALFGCYLSLHIVKLIVFLLT